MVLNRIIKVLFLVLLIGLPICLAVSLYYLDKHYFLCPIDYKWDVLIRFDSRGDGTYAARRNGNRMHNGIDLLADAGTPVYACRSGYARVLEQKNGMGNYIMLQHSGNIATLYGHLSVFEIKDGDFVKQGQLIGKTGKTGNSNHAGIQPHLHFEVRKNGVLQDPMEYLE